MDYLGKISILISILGIIFLLFLITNFDLNFNSVKDMTENNQGRMITLNGEIINVKETNDSLILNLKTECYVDVLYYEENHNLKTEDFFNRFVKIKGTINNYFNPSIYADSIRTIN